MGKHRRGFGTDELLDGWVIQARMAIQTTGAGVADGRRGGSNYGDRSADNERREAGSSLRLQSSKSNIVPRTRYG